MASIGKTEAYEKWIRKLRDRRARARINIRLRRLLLGIPGDARSVGRGVWELRIDYGPGYRVYFMRVVEQSFVLLRGGDKGSQKTDIELARKMARMIAGRRENGREE
ncbi:MAG: type II toxin-antitoxin system RelE/ParE family toxin [Gammaproteobacteria bacterium]|nr:type II toxin-antitoxin system RelE/ParE family toxin [Gammaproteobacteria bacterium]MCY4254864.1 type II toxin-antitoxin system RelE/ParE family toxin [Gammaproteobacteria bacterium]